MEPEKFLELPVFLPPLDEQKAIADKIDWELEHIRSLIDKTNRSIELLKEKRSALITAAVTGKTDAEKALFLDTYIALIQGEGATVYHRLDCADFDEAAGFVAYNTASAEAMGYTACTKCH